jgi:hypothetical protein
MSRRSKPLSHPPTKAAFQHPSRHALYAAITGMTGVVIGFLLAYFFGNWLKADVPTEATTIGRIATLRMPVGARRLDQIKTFILKGGGGDDFGRIYANNYIVNSGETPNNVFYTTNPLGVVARKLAIDNANDRAIYMMADKDIKIFLKKGKNYIVQELENSILGTCVASIDILVNGIELEGFPQNLPDDLYVEKTVSNAVLLSKFQAAAAIDAKTTKVGVSALADALCSRRVWEIELE